MSYDTIAQYNFTIQLRPFTHFVLLLLIWMYITSPSQFLVPSHPFIRNKADTIGLYPTSILAALGCLLKPTIPCGVSLDIINQKIFRFQNHRVLIFLRPFCNCSFWYVHPRFIVPKTEWKVQIRGSICIEAKFFSSCIDK